MIAQSVAPDDEVNFEDEDRHSPYDPSWLDRFSAWVNRLPGPPWLSYLGIWLILFLFQSLVMWLEEAYPVGTFVLAHGVLAGEIAFFLALPSYLDRVAAGALTR